MFGANKLKSLRVLKVMCLLLSGVNLRLRGKKKCGDNHVQCLLFNKRFLGPVSLLKLVEGFGFFAPFSLIGDTFCPLSFKIDYQLLCSL